MPRSPHRLTAAIAALAILTAVAPATASAQPASLNRLDYEATNLQGHPDLVGGGVFDVTLGRRNGAREVHRVNGAAPSSLYTVSAQIYFATSCRPDDPFGPVTIEEGILSTNRAGNGRFIARFPGSAFDTAPDEIWVRWQLLAGDQPAYATACTRIVIGP